MGNRTDKLAARLLKGAHRTAVFLGGLDEAQWELTLYEEPVAWTVRDLAAHLLSAEEGLLRIAHDIAAGGRGAPESLDYDAYNAGEQIRLRGIPPAKLLTDLATTRQEAVAWIAELDEATLERTGHHPALGEVTLEQVLNAIHAHQLMHIRDLQALLRP
jgi:hypothetical protein